MSRPLPQQTRLLMSLMLGALVVLVAAYAIWG